MVVPKANATDAARSCRETLERLTKWTKSITTWQLDEDKFHLKDAITNSLSAVEQIATVWQLAWKTSIRDEFSGLVDLAQLLEDAKGGKGAADKLKKAAVSAQAIQEVQTPRGAERKKLLEARQLKKEALELLSQSGADSEVVEFLSAVANRNCTLLLVNAHILDWLKTNGQLTRFRVQRSAPPGATGF